MAKEKEEQPAAEQVPLTDAERLAILEGNSKLTRILLFVVLGILGFALPIVLTISLVGDDSAAEEQIAALSGRIEEVQAKVKVLDEKFAELGKLQVAQAEQLISLQKNLLAQTVQSTQSSVQSSAPKADSQTVAQVSKALLEQERDMQLLLQNQQTSMRDLANMVPGSRSWLEDYNEALNKLLGASRGRVVELQRWARDAGKP